MAAHFSLKYWTTYSLYYNRGAKCSSVLIALAYGAMGRRIDPSWWTHGAISRSSHCPTTGVTKAVVCAILSVGGAYKNNPCC